MCRLDFPSDFPNFSNREMDCLEEGLNEEVDVLEEDFRWWLVLGS